MLSVALPRTTGECHHVYRDLISLVDSFMWARQYVVSPHVAPPADIYPFARTRFTSSVSFDSCPLTLSTPRPIPRFVQVGSVRAFSVFCKLATKLATVRRTLAVAFSKSLKSRNLKWSLVKTPNRRRNKTEILVTNGKH